VKQVVLDASALLALVHDEPGGEVVETLLENSVMSAVNWSEVVQRSRSVGVDVDGLRSEVEALGVAVLSFDAVDAESTAELWSAGTRSGLSLADRACLALARRLEGVAVTANRSWRALGSEIEIRVIR
jgi:PIN domain nuclease of toxin-antitoxin system